MENDARIKILTSLDWDGFQSTNWVYDVSGVAPTLNTCGGGGLQPKIVTCTIDSTDKNYPFLQSDKNPNDLEYDIRMLTPREFWRLMGFTDEQFDRAQKINSNSQLYKQGGNSIVVECLEAIFKQLGIGNE